MSESTSLSKGKTPFLDFSNLKGDIYGGLTAGVVALPLAIAFGVASEAGPSAGLWGAIIVGFLASLFGGTGSQVTGPTGPMVVVFAGVFGTLTGNLPLIFAAVVLAGIIQILMGVLRVGQYIRLVPYPVISGFMSGIGIIIISLQTSSLLGHKPEESGTIGALKAIPGALADPNFSALAIGVVTLLVIFLWPARFGKIIPGALAALIIGTLLSLVLKGAPLLGEIPTGLPDFVLPALNLDTISVVGTAAITLALLGAIDSLLTSLVADNMTKTRHDSNKELIGQGIGNTVAGLFGAIPSAGATMRTVINIRTGGQTKLSGMFHSLFLLAVVLLLAPVASQIPLAALAGILIKVGYDIIDVDYFKKAHKGPRWDLILMVIVVLLTVFVDLIMAVGVGVVLASLGFLQRVADDQLGAIAKSTVRSVSDEENELMASAQGRVVMFDFGGPLSFSAAADLGYQVRQSITEKTSAIVLDFEHVPFLDVTAAKAIETVACDAKEAGRTLFVAGMQPELRKVLSGLNADHCFGDGVEYPTRIDALRSAVNASGQ